MSNPKLKIVSELRRHLSVVGEHLTKANITTGSLVVLVDLRVIRAALIDVIDDLETIAREAEATLFFLRTELDAVENQQLHEREGRKQ